MAYTTSNTEVQTTYILRKFLEALTPKLQFAKLATPGDLPGGSGDEVRWLDMPEVTLDVSALSETTATDNEVTSYTITAVSGSVSDYGQWMKISERQRKTMVATAYDQIADRFAFAGAKTMDDLLYEQAKNSTTYFKCGETATGTGTLTSSEKLQAISFNYCKAALDANGCHGFDMFGGDYAAVVHPAAAAHMKAEAATTSGIPTWSELNKYIPGAKGQDKVIHGQEGSVFGVTVLSSPVIDKVEVDTAVSGYANIVLAKDGLGNVAIGDTQPSVILKAPGANDTSQPLNTWSSVGWKLECYAAKLLSSSRVIVLYSAA